MLRFVITATPQSYILAQQWLMPFFYLYFFRALIFFGKAIFQNIVNVSLITYALQKVQFYIEITWRIWKVLLEFITVYILLNQSKLIIKK